MRKTVITCIVALLFVTSAFVVVGCGKKVSEVKEDKLAAEAARKDAEARAERERMAARIGKEEQVPQEERIRESILKTEEEVPPQASARGKEFGSADTALKTIYFEFDKSSLTPEMQKILKENAEWLKNNPNVETLIEGHCDERGTEEYNLALGEKRAMSVRKFLISQGVEPLRLYTISYGEEKPVDAGHNEDAWAKNRRAKFQITSF